MRAICLITPHEDQERVRRLDARENTSLAQKQDRGLAEDWMEGL